LLFCLAWVVVLFFLSYLRCVFLCALFCVVFPCLGLHWIVSGCLCLICLVYLLFFCLVFSDLIVSCHVVRRIVPGSAMVHFFVCLFVSFCFILFVLSLLVLCDLVLSLSYDCRVF
jgi:hypothetical protein